MTVQTFFATSRWLRLSLLLLPLCMGAALVTSSISDRQRAYTASELLIRGQVDWLLRSLGQALRSADGPADRQVLEEMLEEFEPEGLRYLALLDQSGAVRVAAGTSDAGPPVKALANPGASLEIARVGTRVRVAASPPKRRFRGLPGRRLRPGFEARRARPLLVLEFEPALADTLRRDADRAFALSAVAALVLMLVAGALWWQLRRQELAARTLERERRLAQLGEMSAVLAHEMRNPLASLKGHAQLLVEKLPQDTREAKKAERIVAEAARLETLSTTLLDFVRAGTIDRRATDVTVLIHQAVEQVGPERIEVEGPPSGGVEVNLDPIRMHQVLVNLLQNALQASSDDEPVRVLVSRTGKRLRIEVRDRGPGLPPGDEMAVFEAFHTKKTHGTGLGLAIARRIVELHEGQISASNHPEGGAVFVVELPL